MADKTEGSTRSAGDAPASRRNIFIILGGLVLVGLAAGCSWLRGLPKD